MKVFISHSSQDKRFVRTLKRCLHENDIETWVDEDQLELGDKLIEKLEDALVSSSHLVIVLSKASVESDWVRLELKKAIINQRTGLTNKIIPIKLKKCEIPEELTDLLYGDLTEEVVLVEDDHLKFISNGFEPFFLKLVKALRNSEKSINQNEKKEIIESIKLSEKEVVDYSQNIYRSNLKVISYASASSKMKYQNRIKMDLKTDVPLDEYLPFLFPASVKNYINAKIGDKFEFEYELISSAYGHFAGYRNDDLCIALDDRTRNELSLKNNEYHQVEIDPKTRLISFKINITDSSS